MLPASGVYGIIDTSVVPDGAYSNVAEALADGGCQFIQLRMKGVADSLRLAAQRRVGEILGLRDEVTWLVVNDRPDLALILARELTGNVKPACHLGQDDMPVHEARKILGPDAVIGLSTHNETQAREAEDLPVDYIGVGPVFSTGTKHNPDPVVGLEKLATISRASKKPVVAIGGIEGSHVPDIVSSGARWVTSIGGLYAGIDVTTAGGLRKLSQRVMAWHREGWGPRSVKASNAPLNLHV